MMYVFTSHIPLDIFEEMIALGEGYKTEFREKVRDPVEAARSICAFSNGTGGNLFLGIGSRGGLIGVLDCYLELEKIERAVAMIIPKPELKVHRVPFQNCDIVRMEIGEGANKPYFVKTPTQIRAFVRVESENVPAGKKMLKSILGDGKSTSVRASRDRKLLLDLFEMEKQLTVRQIKDQLGISERKTRQLLEVLVREGLVVPSLHERNTYMPADRL
jgi:predicted HTH transcriptional regulator